MPSMVQYFSAIDKMKAEKLRNEIQDTFKGSKQYEHGDLVISPVEHVVDVDTGEVARYGFAVFYDAVEIDSEIQCLVMQERRNMKHRKYSSDGEVL